MIEVTQELVRAWIPPRARAAHKGDFGRVHMLAGSRRYTGAPYFAAQAAVRSGAGLVFVYVPQEAWPVVAVKCNEAMVIPYVQEDGERQFKPLHEADAVLIGPGLGRDAWRDALTCTLVQALPVPLVLDADGINALSEHIDILKARQGRLTVLTPHEGEFARLTGGAVDSSKREAVAQDFARCYGCILVLKGHRTLTAFPDGRVFVNTTGNPGMAKGGSGDVLAGMIASLLGQGLAAERAVPAAVWLHGKAGDLCAARMGEYGMTPTDMLAAIPEAFPL